MVSTGNVGQLAADLLIAQGSAQSTLTWSGSLESPHILPVAGYEAYPGQPPRLVTALELYEFAAAKVAVIQQRGAMHLNGGPPFAADLLFWALESGFKVGQSVCDGT